MPGLLDRLRGRGYKYRLLNLHDEFWDRRLGVRTVGHHPATGQPQDPDWKGCYIPSPYSDIFRLLRLVRLSGDDVFVDFGCGMGRTVFAASWLGAARAIGVELVQPLCERADDNYRRSRLGHRKIEFVCSSAEYYNNPTMTVCFMFHPFGEAILTKVLGNMELNRETGHNQRLRIVYMNPVHEAVLGRMDWLKCIGRVPRANHRFSHVDRYETSLWESR
jgi:SAM-dependent methyltransferase